MSEVSEGTAKRILCNGNEAIGHGALAAGCRFFCGYPITPQNEIPAFFARELPKVGGTFVQTESEISSINMLLGVVSTGMRGITSTSSPGFSLMQEGMSAIHALQLPAVVVDVQRGGPGSGSIATAQTDYSLATRSAGHGGMRSIVLAPSSVQECHDLVQLAFYLSDKYRILTIVLSDAIIGQGAEMLEIKTHEFGELPKKTWALRGSAEKKGLRIIMDTYMPFHYGSYFKTIQKKFDQIEAEEARFEGRHLDDSDILVASWGSSARTSLEAINEARDLGIKAGLFRPITLYPFPRVALKEAADKAGKVLVVEDNQGQMLYDVEWALGGSVPVSFVGIERRDLVSGMGLLYPQPVLDEIRRLGS
jgi:2-oxoglutarate ferredoxin oxidoreductase subunit alpha